MKSHKASIILALVVLLLYTGVVSASTSNYGGLDVLDESGYYEVSITSNELCGSTPVTINSVSWVASGYDTELTYTIYGNWYDSSMNNIGGGNFGFSSSGTFDINSNNVDNIQLSLVNDEEVYDVINFTLTLDYTCLSSSTATPVPSATPIPDAENPLTIPGSMYMLTQLGLIGVIGIEAAIFVGGMIYKRFRS